MTTATERRVTCRVLDLPPLLVAIPGGEICPCQVVEVTAETKAGPVTKLYALSRHGNHALFHRAGGDPYQVESEGACDCPAGNYHPESRCKHHTALKELEQSHE